MENESYIYKKYEFLANQYQEPNRNVSIIKMNLLYILNTNIEKESRQLPSYLLNGSISCKWCFNNWTLGSFTSELISEKKRKSSIRSLLKKDQSNLNKFQRKLVTKCLKNNGNKLILSCHFCSKKTIMALNKPVVLKPLKKDIFIGKEKKKKKKKKSVNAGLNLPVVKKINSNHGINTKIPTPHQIKVSNKPKPKQKKKVPVLSKNQNTRDLLMSLLDPM
uniref:Uncharacterized protein n=1 Tax=Clastoptera arizonana TaxID=38151 RepID=A0A1B6CIL6_9HEMI